MLRIVLFFVGFIFLISMNQVLSANEKCPRQLDKVEEGRKCRKSCNNDADCKGAKKGCHCDDICGLSCFNITSECIPLPRFENGHINIDSNLYGATARYECNEGYDLVGEPTRSCRSDKAWSGTIPNCEVGCSKPPQYRVSFTLAEGIGFSVGTKMTYICRFGFTLVGENDIECLSNFTWSQPRFECIKVSCGDPGKPLNGYLEGDDFNFGSWVIQHCDKGYVIDEPRQIRRLCSTTGRWSGELGTCSKIKCDPPKRPENGVVDVSDLSLEFKSLANYNCDFGYMLIGSSQGECNGDGNWGDVPICTVDVNCNFDGVANPLCGYTNIGDGVWGREFELEKTVSGNPSYVLRATSTPAILRSPVIPSAGPYCFQFHYYITMVFNNDSLTITTQNRREKVGVVWPKERIRKWHQQQITIQPMMILGGIQYQINMNDGSTQVDFDNFLLHEGACSNNCPPETCLNKGTCIDRVAKFVCICDRFHTGLKCETVITCSDLPQLKHGVPVILPDPSVLRVDTKVEFLCNKGYTLFGPKEITCMEDGTWSRRKRTTCKVITCSDLPQLKHGVPVISPDPSVLRVDTKVEFLCNKGYTLFGPKEITCTEDGTWSQRKRTTCTEILCGKPASNPGGSVLVDSERLTIGTVATYTCPIGTFLKGKYQVIVCGRNGKWSGDGQTSCSKQNPRPFTTRCPKGYRNMHMMCYKVFKRQTCFFDAAALCHVDGASLAIVRSREERQRLEELAEHRYPYHLGLTDVGRRNMIWLDGGNFEKIAGEIYTGNLRKGKHIKTRPRCGGFLRSSRITSILSSPCGMMRRFICQTFSRSIVPVEIISQDLENLEKISGVYRPIMGLGYNGGIVYKQERNRNFYLFKTDSGWSIGDFNVSKTQPVKEKDICNTISNAAVPQSVVEEWIIGSALQTRMGNVADISITIYDLWTSWSTWGPCTRTCGMGTQTKTRNCRQEGGSPGYGDCKGQSFVERKCNTKQCIKTRWGDWSDWNRCSKSCGVGSRTRTRTCIKDPESSEHCFGRDEGLQTCNLQNCKPARWGDWSDWNRCSKLCGGGSRTRTRTCIKDPESSEHCVGRDEGLQTCNLQNCKLETSNWKRLKASEYQLGHGSGTHSDAQDKCGFKGGQMAMLGSSEVHEFLTEMLNNLHCKSQSANTEWTLWVTNAIGRKIGNTTVDPSVNKTDISNVTNQQCDVAMHSCGLMNLTWSTVKCNFPGITKYVCERVRKPCYKNSCGNRGKCTNVEEGTYIYDCFDNYQGENCETEFAFPCNETKVPENGELEVLPKFQNEILKSGTKVTLRCTGHYKLVGESKIECGKDGRWSGSLGKCTNNTSCELDLQKLHKDAEAWNSEYVVIVKNTIFAVDQTAFIFCKRGQGTLREFKCTSMKGWSPDIFSYCQ